MDVTPSGSTTSLSPVQPEKAGATILVTLSATSTHAAREKSNTFAKPRFNTAALTFTYDSPVQPSNAEAAMFVTLPGIVTETKFVQPWKMPAGIRVTPSGITSRSNRGPSSLTGTPPTWSAAPCASGLASASANESAYQSASVGIPTRARFGHPANTPAPISTSPDGSVTETRFVQSRNAPAGSPAADGAPDTVSRQTFVPAVWVRVCVPDVQGRQRNVPPLPANVAASPSTVTVTVSSVREWASTARGVSPGTVSPSVQAAETEMVGAVPVQSVVRGSAPHPDRRPDSTRNSASVAFLVSSFIVVSFPFKSNFLQASCCADQGQRGYETGGTRLSRPPPPPRPRGSAALPCSDHPRPEQ